LTDLKVKKLQNRIKIDQQMAKPYQFTEQPRPQFEHVIFKFISFLVLVEFVISFILL